MVLKPRHLAEIAEKYPTVRDRLEWLTVEILGELSPTLKVMRAREYLQHGVCRRLRTIHRCLVNVFTVFPPERTAPLPGGYLSDVTINLQAFIANVYGVFDNLAWVYILEQRREKSINRQAIGLFDKRTQVNLPRRIREYVEGERMKTWFADYSKNFRDALAHRIPPYVPPFMATRDEHKRWEELDAQIPPAIKAHRFEDAEKIREERDAIGKACPLFRHSFTESDGLREVVLHPQLIADAMTVTELMDAVMTDVKTSGWGVPP